MAREAPNILTKARAHGLSFKVFFGEVDYAEMRCLCSNGVWVEPGPQPCVTEALHLHVGGYLIPQPSVCFMLTYIVVSVCVRRVCVYC